MAINSDDPLDRLLAELAAEAEQADEAQQTDPEDGEGEQEQQTRQAKQQPKPPVELPDPQKVDWEPSSIVEAAVEMATAKTAIVEQAMAELRSEFPELTDEELGQISHQLRMMRPQDLKAFYEQNGHRGLG
ncbi:MAG: hypothetical protein N2109_13575, partial [Fimbriimonadales bacterium]|nr:hypothetical protein [Fimbriimonadales bacterium]